MTRSWALALLVAASSASAAPRHDAPQLPRVEHVVIVVLENEDPERVPRDGFLARLAKEGASLEQCHALARPSQPNYFAMTSGSTQVTDNAPHDVAARHVGTLLEEKGLTWRCYAQGYPGGCFLDERRGKYARKHVPFISYVDVHSDPARCAERVVPFERFREDLAAGLLPAYSFVVPDLDDDGHDTSVKRADRWMGATFGPLLEDPSFTAGTLLIVTFDEGAIPTPANRIYTSFWGQAVRPGAKVRRRVTHYDVLRTIEALFGLPTLTVNDEAAEPITGVWKLPPR